MGSFRQFSNKYEDLLPEILENVDNISHIYVCGPPSMNFSVEKSLKALNISRQKYTIL